MKSDLPIPALVLGVLPIVITIATLAVSIVFFPQNSQDIRSSAAPVKISPTPIPLIAPRAKTNPRATAEIACSSLYSPVCGINGKTYLNSCEAQKARIQVAAKQECAQSLPSPTSPVKITPPVN